MVEPGIWFGDDEKFLIDFFVVIRQVERGVRAMRQ